MKSTNVIYFGVKMVHGQHFTLDHIKSSSWCCSSGTRPISSAELPFMRRRERRWRSSLVVTSSISPICLAWATASLVTCSLATLRQLPRVSAAKGIKASSACLQSSPAFAFLQMKLRRPVDHRLWLWHST